MEQVKSKLKQIPTKVKSLAKTTYQRIKTKFKPAVASVIKKFKTATPVQRGIWGLAVVLIVGSLAVAAADGVISPSSTEPETVSTQDSNEEPEVSVREKRQLLTGQAESNSDAVDVTLGVHKQHEYRKIWANFSDDVDELERSAGRISHTVDVANRDQYEVYQVQIPGQKIEPGKTYYYQAVGQTENGNRFYGRIASFDINP